MAFPLASRVALVTGAASGIGRAAAIALAKAGAHVVAASLPNTGLDDLDRAIAEVGGTGTQVPIDLTDFESIARLAAQLREQHGRLDVLLGNAGIAASMAPLAETDLKTFTGILAVNVTANFQLIRCMEPLLRASDAGRAVFTTSSVAHRAPKLHGPYSTSKAALDTLVRVWAAELADTPIRVNLFSPGPARTQMRTLIIKGEDPMTLPTPEQLAEFIVPMCLPSWTETGGIYDYRARAIQRVQPPR